MITDFKAGLFSGVVYAASSGGSETNVIASYMLGHFCSSLICATYRGAAEPEYASLYNPSLYVNLFLPALAIKHSEKLETILDFVK